VILEILPYKKKIHGGVPYPLLLTTGVSWDSFSILVFLKPEISGSDPSPIFSIIVQVRSTPHAPKKKIVGSGIFNPLRPYTIL
jgi:hypothetical protein